MLAVASLYLVGRTLASAETSRAAVVKSFESIDRLSESFRLLQDVETGVRGYVITGNTVFLETYDATVKKLVSDLAALARSRDPQLRLLATAMRAKLDYSKGTVALRRDRGANAAIESIRTQQGKRLMDVVRSHLAEVVGNERTLLASRAVQRSENEQRGQRTVFAVLAASQLLAIIIGVLLLSSNRRQRTAKRAARLQSALLRATLENINSGIALLESNGRLIDCNARLAKLLGVAKTTDVATGIGSDERDAARSGLPFTLVRIVDDNTALEILGQKAPDDLYVLTYTDISDRLRADRLKTDFVSTVSHELRTPLTAIRGALGILAGPMANSLPASAVSLLDVANRNALRLNALVNDLLDIDKIESGAIALQLDIIDLNQLANEAAQANRAFAIQRGVLIAVGHPAEPVMVSGDPGRLQQVVANLISNAAKFSLERGIVTITVERSANHARVSIHDTGEGIPEAFHSRIFGKFAQAATGDAKRVGGSGLGLHISKAIIERHGGTIKFRSRPGDTVFTFSLPARSQAGASWDQDLLI